MNKAKTVPTNVVFHTRLQKKLLLWSQAICKSETVFNFSPNLGGKSILAQFLQKSLGRWEHR